MYRKGYKAENTRETGVELQLLPVMQIAGLVLEAVRPGSYLVVFRNNPDCVDDTRNKAEDGQ